ncbi:hypothetical protein [Microcella sp.]|uniref:hypothetical protein n=1 Tax=Microcella sp. TaxID=1913979 RepID=UPI00391BC98B
MTTHPLNSGSGKPRFVLGVALQVVGSIIFAAGLVALTIAYPLAAAALGATGVGVSILGRWFVQDSWSFVIVASGDATHSVVATWLMWPAIWLSLGAAAVFSLTGDLATRAVILVLAVAFASTAASAVRQHKFDKRALETLGVCVATIALASAFAGAAMWSLAGA